MPTKEELQAMLEQLFQGFAADGEAPTAEEIEEALGADVLADVGREDYVAALDGAMDAAEVPADAREPLYEQLDGEGEYTPDGIRDNIRFLFEQEEITNAIDNSITIEGGGGGYDDHGYDTGTEVHDITQHNSDNQANAAGDGAIAGRDQSGQFQTGEGAQVGDYNEGVVFQGENSGQVAGNNAEAGDITGDGGISVGGNVDNSGFGTGSGDVSVNVDESHNDTVDRSYNDDNVGNTNDSFNQHDVGNTDYTTEITHEESLEANLTVEDSFKVDVEEAAGYDHDDHDDHYELDH